MAIRELIGIGSREGYLFWRLEARFWMLKAAGLA